MVEQLRVSGQAPVRAEVAGRFHQPMTKVMLPDPVHHDAGGERIGRVCQPFSEFETSASLAIIRQFLAAERQNVFTLTCRLFAEFESGLKRAPEHWLYWDRLPRVSTPLGTPPTTQAASVMVDIATRCRAFPGLLRRVPELRPCVEAAAP